MRAFLTLPVYARAMRLPHIRSIAQTAVALNRENCDVASGVIRYQYKSAVGRHIHITGIGAQRRFLIPQPQFTRLLIHSKGADGSAFSTLELLDFVDRIQIAPAGCESEKRRINHIPRGSDML